jgi:hypothetical protein
MGSQQFNRIIKKHPLLSNERIQKVEEKNYQF